MNRQRLILAILVGIFALSVLYAFWATPRQEKAPPRAAAPGPAAKGAAAAKPGQPSADRLNLGLLAQTPQPFPGAGRDIFRFHGGWSPMVEEPAAIEPVVLPAEPVEPPPPPTPEQILQQKISGFTFLGFLDKGGVKTVFLSSGGELYLVKAGDAFGREKSLIARAITPQELVVGSVTGEETVRVRLIENEALKPATLSSGGGGVREVSTGEMGAVRPGGGLFPSRRSVLRQRLATQPIPVEGEAAGDQQPPPNENVTQEELLKQEPPSGEGNGNAK